jgi:hypothetical protein
VHLREPAAGAGLQLAFAGSNEDVEAVQQHRRRLQQASTKPTALGDCSLAVGTNSISFDGCLSVHLNPSALYQIYYSLSPNGKGGTSWRGGLKVGAAQVGGQWAG